MHIAQEPASFEEAEDQPGFACAPVVEGAIKFRSADRQVLEQAVINRGFIAYPTSMAVGIMVAASGVLAEQSQFVSLSQPARHDFAGKRHGRHERFAIEDGDTA